MSHAWTSLDLETLDRNIEAARAHIGPARALVFVVKANAYGHGLVPVARRAYAAGVRWFAVCHAAEGAALRAALPQGDVSVLMLGVAAPEDARTLLELNLQPIVISVAQAASLSAEAVRLGGIIRCHAKIDTGMGRVGFAWERAAKELEALPGLRGIELAGFCSHFACAHSPSSFAHAQHARFEEVLKRCTRRGIPVRFRHIAGSDATCCNPDWHLDAVRLGILLYGYGIPGPQGRLAHPVLSWRSRIVQVKRVPAEFPVGYDSTYRTPAPTCIGTVPVGYSDGYPRSLSNKGILLAGGRRVPLVGRVSMNYLTVDLGPDPAAGEGDEVVLLGRQGSASIWADELARLAGTISYEIVTGIRSPPGPAPA